MSLPPEILYEILSYSLDSAWSRRESFSVLLTCSLFRDICLQILYIDLHFTSHAQLLSFTTTYSHSPPPYAPRSVALDISGDDSGLIFLDLYALFSQCFSAVLKGAERDEDGRLSLELLRLRLNSHSFDPHVEMIYTSLSLVSPHRFIWTGPDPPHHFSIAIVPEAAIHLFRAISSYSNLIYLKLTHLTMAYQPSFNTLPTPPSLQTLYLGQVVFLHPLSVANLVLHPSMKNLERVALVDAYTGSIWGLRLRRSDIERAAIDSTPVFLPHSPEDSTPINANDSTAAFRLDLIRKIVVCEARTERIIGGDRVENNAILL